MKKLALQIEALAVESFHTGDADGPLGTVHALAMAPTYPYPGCPVKTKPTDCPCTPAF